MYNTKRFKPILLTTIILISGIVAILYMNNQWSRNPIELKNTLANQVTEQQETKDLKSIIHESQKNVVQIETITEYSEKIGSGFLYNSKGDIITNAHVVKDAKSIYVKTANAQTYTAALVGIGETKDIAVVRVPQLSSQTPASIDNEYQPELGDDIIAVGSPLGFQNSVTLGIISGMNRSFTIDEYDYQDAYQISAHITHGNSGGPLINRSTGNVIGVNSAGTQEGNLGFSIPIQTVIEDVEKWSNQADHKKLNYDSLINNNKIDNPERLKSDADYIIRYFFDSLSIRDYINAYTLLGSDWQSKTSYQEFRENYIHVSSNEISNMNFEYLDDEQIVKVTLQAAMEVRQSNKEIVDEHYEYTFYIGFENDQLKILDGSRNITNV